MCKKTYIAVTIDFILVTQDVVTTSGVVGVQWSDAWGDTYEGWR